MSGISDFPYRHDDLALAGRIARPGGPGPHPAVLLVHSALGPDPMCERRATELADMGYVALAADMYGKGPMGPELDHAGAFMALQADPVLLRARVVAAFEALRELPEVASDRIGALGYCFGGQCVLELARSGAAVAAVVSFHGLLKTAQPAEAGTVRARMLVLTGAKDPYAPLDDVATFQTEMTAAAADWQVTIYGEGYHAFTAPDIARHDVPGTRYDPLLDRLSWAQSTAFLDAALGR